MVGSAAAVPLAISAGQILLSAPPLTDGPQNITLTDPASGASSTMTNVLTYGAAATDTIALLTGINPSTAAGAQAPNPVVVRVLASDGITPVSGATIGWSATNALQLSACAGNNSCSVTTDQNGGAFTWLTPSITGKSTITATLAPGVYSPAQSVSATLSSTETVSDIGVLNPILWVAQGATISIPLTARALRDGAARNNVTINFTVNQGSATLSAPSAQTNSGGYATVNLSLTQLSAAVQVSACVAPASPCQSIYANPVAPAQQNLQPMAGAGQVSADEAFQPVVVRVTDSSSSPNPVIAAGVLFQTTVLRPGGGSPAGGNGETNPSNPVMPVILSVTQTNATTDLNGLASIVPSGGNFSPPVEVDVAITAGTNAQLNDPLELLPALADTNNTDRTKPTPVGRPPAHIHWP